MQSNKLVAHNDDKLSQAAAEQLVAMSEDKTLPEAVGADLPEADAADLLTPNPLKARRQWAWEPGS